MKHAKKVKKTKVISIKIDPAYSYYMIVFFSKTIKSIQVNIVGYAENLRQQLFKFFSRAVYVLFETGRMIDRARLKQTFQLDSRIDALNKSTNCFRSAIIRGEDDYLSTPISEPDCIKFWTQWPIFSNCFTHEELNNLNNYIHNTQCKKKYTILKKGTVNRRLFFIESGTVKINDLYRNTDREIILSGGDIVGDLSFFSGIHHPFSATAEPGTVFKYIDYNDIKILNKRFPDFDRSLHALCIGQKSGQGVKGPVILPRLYKRVNVSGVVSIQRINTRGIREGNPFRGRLFNISQGGYAFQFKSTDKSEISSLNGALLNAVLDIERLGTWDDILWRGTVVRVRKTEPQLYSVHVKGLNPNPKVSSLLNELIS